ncbi:C40 family peptidase [Frigoribacterium sp. Leaf164]|uniref:C40 family peptidase n=1 Tax=Frigoribacterium sp. Leaf164 TaxID=1736282 RepID=UPI0012E257D4|nr:C40 family peptidase [Frigoribacterium sp. Leaf164]
MTSTASADLSGTEHSDRDASTTGGGDAPLLRPRGRRRAQAAVLPTTCRASFVQSDALVAASEAATGPLLRGRRSAARADAVAAQAAELAGEPVAAPTAGVSRKVVSARAASASRAADSTRASGRRAAVPSAAAAPTSPAPAPAPAARRLGAVVKKVSVVAALIGFAASGTLPLLASADQGAQAVAAGPGASAARGASQSLSVDGDVIDADMSRDAYSATSLVDLATQVKLNSAAASTSVWDGRTTESYLADPLYPTLDRDQVLAVAMQYIGTPYVHGGEDPTKFDCSGLITFVYSQFGISLTHYVPTQDAEGTRVSAEDAVPGDLVVFDNLAHDGIYAGNGMILDAPKPGGFVAVRPIWDQPHHFVRIGA